MQPKHFRDVLQRHVGYEVIVLLDVLALRQRVALVELEVGAGKVLREPDRCEGVQQSLVKVVCDSSAILNLSQHEANSLP